MSECNPYLQVSGSGWKLCCRVHHSNGRGAMYYKLSKQELAELNAAPDREAARMAKHNEVLNSPKTKFAGNPDFRTQVRLGKE